MATLADLVAVQELWWDNETGIGRRGGPTDPVTALIGMLGSRIVQLNTFDPQSNGSSSGPVPKTSFLPGRSFDTPDDCNAQLAQRLPVTNARQVRVLDGRPIDLLDTDRVAILAMPPVSPVVDTVTSMRLGGDHYAPVARNHDRCCASRQTLTNPTHAETAASLSQQF